MSNLGSTSINFASNQRDAVHVISMDIHVVSGPIDDHALPMVKRFYFACSQDKDLPVFCQFSTRCLQLKIHFTS